MNVIEFLRVSTQEQSGDDRAGLARQKEANAITIRRHGLRVIKTITLVDVSGTSVLHTPEVKELLSIIRSETVDGVVVADFDRLIRMDDYRDMALFQDFKEANTLIYLPDQVIDLNSQSGFITCGFHSTMSGNELLQIKKRMMEAKEIKRRNGEHPNSYVTLPKGVAYDRKQKQFYYTEEAALVKRLFYLFYDQGIQNYCELERHIGIQHRTIPNLLQNEIYIGYRTYTEKRSKIRNIKPGGRQADRKKVKRQPNEIIRVRVIDEPLVDENVFRAVQEIIRTKRREYHKKRASEGERFLYSGFLKCGVCGEIVYSTSGGHNHKKDYYYCRSKNYQYKKKYGDPDCRSSYIPKEVVESSITSFVSERFTEKGYLKKMVRLALDGKRKEANQTELNRLKRTLKLLDDKRTRVLDLYVDGKFRKEKLDKKIADLDDEKAAIDIRVTQLEEACALNDKMDLEATIRPIVATLAEFAYWSPSQKRTFLRSQIPAFTITKDGITGLSLNFCKFGNHTDMGSSQPPP